MIEIDSAINELDTNTNNKFQEIEQTHNEDIDEIRLELANHTHTVFDNDIIINGEINGFRIRNSNLGPCENTIPCIRVI